MGRPKKIKEENIKKESKVVKKNKEDDEVIDYVNKKYGNGKIFKIQKKEETYNPEDFIDSGSMCLNYIITGDYRCGFPRQRPIEIYGQEGVCKSTLALTASKFATNKKQKGLYADAEKGLNPYYAKQLNINRDYFYYFLADCAEDAFTISEDLLLKFDFDFFIFDSVGGSKTRSVIENGFDSKNMGDHAKLMGNSIIKMGGVFFKKNIAPIFINQLGKKIGEYGDPNETKGGKTFKYQLWCRIELTAPRKQKIEETIKQKGTLEDVIDTEDEEESIEEKKTKNGKKTKEKPKSNKKEIGTIITAKTVKNKLFIPRRSCRLKLIYGKGFDRKFDFLEYLDMQGLIKRKGPKKILYNGVPMMNSSFWKKYKEDQEFKKEIWGKIESHRLSLQKIEEDENFID